MTTQVIDRSTQQAPVVQAHYIVAPAEAEEADEMTADQFLEILGRAVPFFLWHQFRNGRIRALPKKLRVRAALKFSFLRKWLLCEEDEECAITVVVWFIHNTIYDMDEYPLAAQTIALPEILADRIVQAADIPNQGDELRKRIKYIVCV